MVAILPLFRLFPEQAAPREALVLGLRVPGFDVGAQLHPLVLRIRELSLQADKFSATLEAHRIYPSRLPDI